MNRFTRLSLFLLMVSMSVVTCAQAQLTLRQQQWTRAYCSPGISNNTNADLFVRLYRHIWMIENLGEMVSFNTGEWPEWAHPKIDCPQFLADYQEVLNSVNRQYPGDSTNPDDTSSFLLQKWILNANIKTEEVEQIFSYIVRIAASQSFLPWSLVEYNEEFPRY